MQRHKPGIETREQQEGIKVLRIGHLDITQLGVTALQRLVQGRISARIVVDGNQRIAAPGNNDDGLAFQIGAVAHLIHTAAHGVALRLGGVA